MWRSRLAHVTWPEVPKVKKCCFCIPVRKGIIIFGYINLTLSLLAFPLLVFLLVEQLSEESAPVREPARLPLTVAWVAVDVAMNLALIASAHKKNASLLRLYLVVGGGFQLLTLLLDLLLFDLGDVLENVVYFFFLSLNVYLLYLVFCTIHQLRETSGVQYMAHRDPPPL
ncbi:unnamed protein product [Plutella xylostella]|uniref:(diamondback moth) hypothetical protein n=1 Tax=Plutella xylostella TaxID=51655 RepID=A0A8S4F4G0_PLUXY|nr:unnamed protein product [Plutella xylostella]